jgi:hypothetical protein
MADSRRLDLTHAHDAGQRAVSASASANLKRSYKPLGLSEAMGHVITIDQCGSREWRDDAELFHPTCEQKHAIRYGLVRSDGRSA